MRVAVACLILAALASPAAAIAAAPAKPSARALELADQNRRSEALNVAVNRKNAEIQARNDAAKAAYDKALSEHAAAVSAASAAKADYDARMAKHAAEVATYDAALASWKAQACRGADRPGCRAGPVKTAAN